jgi:hypothetical protein
VQFSWSIVQSPKKYGFSPAEIKTGDILVKDNIFDQACQAATDCGALKFWGEPPDGQVFRDVLITGNVFRDTFGWAYVAEQRRRWIGGPSSDVRGMGGFGLYVDMASGITAYRNIAYNNGYAGFTIYGAWRDGDMLFYDNIAANSLLGIFLSAPGFETRSNTTTQLVGNIIVNNEGYGIWYVATGASADTVIDYNQYYRNGWRSYGSGGMQKPGVMIVGTGQDSYQYYQTLDDVRRHTAWEEHGREGDPGFLNYNSDDHDRNSGARPDFGTAPANNNMPGREAAALPESLTALLQKFKVNER